MSNNKAFTLAELLISVSVIVILSGALIPSFVGYIRNQNLKQAKEQIKSDLRTIQNNALTDSIPLGTLADDSMYWGVSFNAGSDTYYYFVSNTDSSCDGMQDEDKSYKLTEDITAVADYCVFFSFNNGSATGSTYVAVTNGKNTECININEAGLIATGTWDEGGSSCN